MSDEDESPDDGYVCKRCVMRPIERVALPPVFDAGFVQTIPPLLLDALGRAASCLAHDGFTIDRAHVEAVHAQFGAVAIPLEPWLAARAVAERPELAGTALLVADLDALLVHPAENWERRIEALRRVQAPDILLDDARASLERARARNVRLEWDRVAPWPSDARFPGTVAFGGIAGVLAKRTLPPLIGALESGPILAAIDRAIAGLSLDAETRSYRHQLSVESENASVTDARRARGLELAVRFLDELGHTDLLTNQDTLVDDCHFALAGVGLGDEAATVYRTWLEVAVPYALRLVASNRRDPAPT